MTFRQKLCLVAAALASVWVFLYYRLAAEAGETRAAAAEGQATITRLQDENRRLQENRPERAPASADQPIRVGATPSPSVVDLATRLRSGAIVGRSPAGASRQGASPASPYILDYTGKLQPGFGLLFGLNDAKVQELQGKLDLIKGRLDKEILQNARAVSLSADSVRVEVQTVPDSDALRNEYLSTLRAGLGDEGYDAFVELNTVRRGPQGGRAMVQRGRALPFATAELFNNFGGSSRQLIISKSDQGYQADEVRPPGGGVRGLRSTDVGGLAPILGPLQSLLPPGF